MRLRVLHTPGHTFHHVSYVLHDADQDDNDEAVAVFTGGSMLFGATGRTDLVSPDATQALTHAQYRSVRRLAAELPAAAAVLPTHGFGSFCSATPTSGNASTVGEQTTRNPALTLAEQDYVDTLLAGLDAYPAYYAQMGPINRHGPAPVDLSAPEPVQPAQLRARIQAGHWVVDLRKRTAFAAGHLPGSLGFELSQPFVTYLGWLYTYGSPLTLIGDNPQQILDARRELARIGIDDLAGATTADLDTLADGQPLRSYPVTDFAGLAAARARGPVLVLDVRRNDERARGHLPGSHHIPLHELAGRIHEIPQGQVWVHCASGYRASIAASILDRPGRTLVLINDSYDSAVAAGLEQPPQGPRREHHQPRSGHHASPSALARRDHPHPSPGAAGSPRRPAGRAAAAGHPGGALSDPGRGLFRVGAELVIHLMRPGSIRGSIPRAARDVGREAGKATPGVEAVAAALPGPVFGEAGGC
jgi:rhodanese-related sulfurtransferase